MAATYREWPVSGKHGRLTLGRTSFPSGLFQYITSRAGSDRWFDPCMRKTRRHLKS